MTETPDGNTEEDDDVVVTSAPLRKKRKNTRTKGTKRKGPPQRPSTPPHRMKTKKTALSSVVSYEEAADLTGVDVRALEPVHTVDVEGGTTAEEGHPNAEVDPSEHHPTNSDRSSEHHPTNSDRSSEHHPTNSDRSSEHHPTNSDRTTDPAEIRLGGLRLADASPPTSSPEEEVVASSLLALRHSATAAPLIEAAVGDGRDEPFVSEDPAVASQPVRSVSPVPLRDTVVRAASSTVAPFPMEKDEDMMGPVQWSAESRRLYRHFYEDVKTAEEQWDHPKTRQGMANLRKSEPLLYKTFFRCLSIARKTMGEGVLHEWRDFQKQGWERRRRLGFDPGRLPTVAPTGSRSASEPGRRDVVTEAYCRFSEAVGAKTNTWKARFQYRRAAIGLAVQHEAYIGIRSGQSHGSIFLSSAMLDDPKVLLRALFREMHVDWRNALPDDFTDEQARDRGYLHEWRAFNQTIQDGKR